MHSRLCCYLAAYALCASLTSWGQSEARGNQQTGVDGSEDPQHMSKVPKGVILVKGAWSSASDSVTPLPEDGNVVGSVFSNEYFGMSWTLPPDWTEKYKGPPPSDRGRYVIAQIDPADTFKGEARGGILITAEDMFFTPLPANNSLEFVNYAKDHLQADYRVEQSPKQTKVGGRSFTFFSYLSPVAELHWYILATEIRCHTVEVTLTSRDTKLLNDLTQDLNKMRFPRDDSPLSEDAFPVCIKDYASGANVIARVDPIFTERRFNSVPVRIIIDKEGRIKHIHLLSAFPDQVTAITDALKQWKFRPYLRNGLPVEVETGIMFGFAPSPMISAATNPTPR
ncbi:MAG: energy transducer TonB [Terracidiphilus sp.]